MINTNQKPTTDTHKIKRKQTNKLLKKDINVKEHRCSHEMCLHGVQSQVKEGDNN